MSAPTGQPDTAAENRILRGVIQRLSSDLQQKIIESAELDVRLQEAVAAQVRAEQAAAAANEAADTATPDAP